MKKVRPEALEALKRYREDLRAGHKDAAEFWRGQASAFLTANPIDLESAPRLVKRGVQELKIYDKATDYYLAPYMDRKVVDEWLVRIKHPLAEIAGQQGNPRAERGFHTSRSPHTCLICKKEIKPGTPFWNRPGGKAHVRCVLNEIRDKRVNPTDGLYQRFHGNPPARTRPVQFTVPKRLVKVGKLKELVYAPEKPSQYTGTAFSHKFGDFGYKFVRGQEPILAVSADGKQLVVVGGSYRFGARGIVG